MSINDRYEPSHPAGQVIAYGMDFSAILPPGVGIDQGTVLIQYNTVPPTSAFDLSATGLPVAGRRLYATISGGTAGRDYRLQWQATDSLGNIWFRTALLLCAATS